MSKTPDEQRGHRARQTGQPDQAPTYGNLPYSPEGQRLQAPYHVVPDNVQGGWNVYDTHQPQEPQRHFQSKQEAIAFAQELSRLDGTGYTVEENEAAGRGF